MGVDMADVIYVIHYSVPCTTDAFRQEAGRAGREDDSKCHSLVINYPHSVSGRPVSKTMRKISKRSRIHVVTNVQKFWGRMILVYQERQVPEHR